MKCHWIKNSLGFDTTKENFNCKDKVSPSSSCFYINWASDIPLGSEYKKDEFLIFLWKQEMRIK